TDRILGFPVRAAAVEDFLAALRAYGAADLNAVMTTLNEGGLCRETLEHWKENGWVEGARATPVGAPAGKGFSRDVTLGEFCGREHAHETAEDSETDAASPATEEESGDEHS